MPKKKLALPARMDLAIDSLSNMTIAVLTFPYAQEVQDFCRDIEQVSRSKKKIYPPYRQLNNGLLACTSTLTYGFEYLETIDYVPQYRALAVGKSAAELNIPTSEQIHDLIFSWARTWTEQYLKKKGNRDEIESVCDRFLDAVNIFPSDWNWEYIQPQTLIKDINAQKALSYQAIPSLLATLMHEQICTIVSGDKEQKIIWRKVQGGGSTKTGLYLVSKPFKANYFDDNDNEREGYFAYRLDFYLQTQAGRFNSVGNLKPWIFLHLSCQRYAHKPLAEANSGRDISVLIGINKARIDNYPIDSTLVRLSIKNIGNKYWQEQLPKLLSAFKARSLLDPQQILDNPAASGNLDNSDVWNTDEYYVIHTEGYKYKPEETARKHGHYIKTGFSLKERADIIAQVLEVLDGVLIPDKSMECDIKTPSGKTMPLAMQDYELIRKSLNPSELNKNKKITDQEKQKYIREQQIIISNAIKRALKEKPLYLFILWREIDTQRLVYQQLRKAFLLQDSEPFPEYITVIDIFIKDANLLHKLAVSGLPSDNSNFNEEIKNQHTLKRKSWQKFLKQNVIPLVDCHTNLNLFAIIEIGTSKVKGIHPQQNIRGAVREACILENISSQMLQTVKPKKKENPDEITGYSKATQGKVLNAVLDLTLRHTATLYGLPSEIYQMAGISQNIAQELDVIAFCRVQKNNFIGKTPLQYAIAVRLNAKGIVDVLLPNHKKWIPYTKAGIAIGKLFHEVRKARNTRGGSRNILEQVQMKGGQLVKFVADTLINHLDNPSIALIEADVWRNERSKDGNNHQAWFQLKNKYLLEQRDILNFSHVLGHNCEYQRNDEEMNNLLSVIRFRSGNETPQYVTSRENWDDNIKTEDFTQLSGFIDKTAPKLLNYFSIGRIPETQKKKQNATKARNLSKIEHEDDIYAANIAYKHQQMIEMSPFFVRPDLQTEEKIKSLCRVPHYLRTSPAYTKGNIRQSYPMYLGINLIEDFLCILDLDL